MLVAIQAMRKGGTGQKDPIEHRPIHTVEEQRIYAAKYAHLGIKELEEESLTLGFSKSTLSMYRYRANQEKRA